MSGKKTIELKPVRTGKTDPKTFARQAEISDRLKASGRTFSDSTETIRQDREIRWANLTDGCRWCWTPRWRSSFTLH